MKKFDLEFAKKQFAIHGHTLLSKVYKNSDTPMRYRCGFCEKIQPIGMSLYRCMHGAVCKKCSADKMRGKRRPPALYFMFHGRRMTLSQILKRVGNPVPYGVAWSRIRKSGMSIHQAIQPLDKRAIIHDTKDGQMNLKQIANTSGIPYSRLVGKNKMQLEDALTMPVQTGKYQIYQNEPAKRWGDWKNDSRRGVGCYTTFTRRLKKGMRPQDAFEISDNLSAKYITIDGIRQPMSKWAAEAGISASTFSYRQHPFLRDLVPTRAFKPKTHRCSECGEETGDRHTGKDDQQRGKCRKCYKRSVVRFRKKQYLCPRCGRKPLPNSIWCEKCKYKKTLYYRRSRIVRNF